MANSDYKVTVGLEVHAELNTRTKMFCDSKNDPDEATPNTNVCPVCMGYPGTLPVINKEAVLNVIKVGLSIGGTIADYTEFDRKNYFYPDIPKGYQISQFAHPLVKGGSLAGISVTRIHLEEDTARSSHEGEHSLVDFNRAGVPLMELVTEPVIHSAEEASRFARELQLLLQTLNVGEANMEKGEMRVEANISVSKDAEKFGTKVEVKNLNSFRAVEKAISYEVKRHIELLEKGESISQETRGWDEKKEITFSQRQKEDSHDYRYFPDPDLPKLYISTLVPNLDAVKENLPELPWEKRTRYVEKFEMREEDAEVYVRSEILSVFFDEVASLLNDSKKNKIASNYISSDLLGLIKSDGLTMESVLFVKITPAVFAELIELNVSGDINSRGTKDILNMMYKGDTKNPRQIAEEHGFIQKNDAEALLSAVQGVIEANPDVVREYQNGKTSVIQYLVGQCMKVTKGAGNPVLLKDLLEKKLAE